MEVRAAIEGCAAREQPERVTSELGKIKQVLDADSDVTAVAILDQYVRPTLALAADSPQVFTTAGIQMLAQIICHLLRKGIKERDAPALSNTPDDAKSSTTLLSSIVDTLKAGVKNTDYRLVLFKILSHVFLQADKRELAALYSLDLAPLCLKETRHGITQSSTSINFGLHVEALVIIKYFVDSGLKLPEHFARDLWKSIKSSLGFKASLVQLAALRCLASFIAVPGLISSVTDVDGLVVLLARHIPNYGRKCCDSAAECLGMLVYCHSSKTKESREERTSLDMSSDPVHANHFFASSLSIISNLLLKYPASSNFQVVCFKAYQDALGLMPPAIIISQIRFVIDHFLRVVSSHDIDSEEWLKRRIRANMKLVFEQAINPALNEATEISVLKCICEDILSTQNVRSSLKSGAVALCFFEVSTLVLRVQDAIMPITDVVERCIMRWLSEGDYVVNMHSAVFLFHYASVVPSTIPSLFAQLMDKLEGFYGLLGDQLDLKLVSEMYSYAYALAGLTGVSWQKPLYTSPENFTRVFEFATHVIGKAAGYSAVTGVQLAEVGWCLISSLMISEDIVRLNLPEIFTLWKEAILKDALKYPDDPFLCNATMKAHNLCLNSIHAFLVHCPKLASADIQMKLLGILSSNVLFLKAVPSVIPGDNSGIYQELRKNRMELRQICESRTFLCFSSMARHLGHAILGNDLLSLSVSRFADPAVIGKPTSSATTGLGDLWNTSDNYAFGLTHIAEYERTNFLSLSLSHEVSFSTEFASFVPRADDIEVRSPFTFDIEDDPMGLLNMPLSSILNYRGVSLASTRLVDSAIILFGTMLPLQPTKVQESILDELGAYLEPHQTQLSAPRILASKINIAIALSLYVKALLATRETASKIGMYEQSILIVKGFLRQFASDKDPVLAHIAGNALAVLCKQFQKDMTADTDYFIQKIMENREPDLRSNCLKTLAWVQASKGRATSHRNLNNVINVMLTLLQDAHPMVHSTALQALAYIIEQCGVPEPKHVLDCIFTFYCSREKDLSLTSRILSNIGLELPIDYYSGVALEAFIMSLGPELPEHQAMVDTCRILIDLLLSHHSTLVCSQAWTCLRQFLLFVNSPGQAVKFVKDLYGGISHPKTRIRLTSLDALYQVVRIFPETMKNIIRLDRGFRLWMSIDQDSNNDAVRGLLELWYKMVCTLSPGLAFEFLYRIASNARDSNRKRMNASDADQMASLDEEAMSIVSDPSQDEDRSLVMFRWQTKLFALHFIYELVELADTDDVENPVTKVLIQRMQDLISLTFTASTSGIVDFGLEGLKLLRLILQRYAPVPDPHFQDLSILEQHQAQIVSALAPGFAEQAQPELAALAVELAADFVSSRAVPELNKMSRVLRLLTGALDEFINPQSQDSGTENVRGILKIAILTSWAKLLTNSSTLENLEDVTRPYEPKLATLWLNSLRSYARLKFVPLAATEPDTASGRVSSIARSVLLRKHEETWIFMVNAIASLLQSNSKSVMEALDPGHGEDDEDDVDGIDYRNEPVAFFFVLFGLCLQSIVLSSHANAKVDLMPSKIEVLSAMSSFLKPEICGTAIYSDAIFNEVTQIFARLVLTEGWEVRSKVTEIVRNIAEAHPAHKELSEHTDLDLAHLGELSSAVDQLFELSRIVTISLLAWLPVMEKVGLDDRAADTIRQGLNAFIEIAQVYPSVIRADLYRAALNIILEFLSRPNAGKTVGVSILPSLKKLCLNTVAQMTPPQSTSVLLDALEGFNALLVRDSGDKTPGHKDTSANAMLAGTIVVTTSHSLFADGPIPVLRFCDRLVEAFGAKPTTVIALQCVKSINSSTIPGLEAVKAYLLKSLVRHLIHSTSTLADTALAEDMMFRFCQLLSAQAISFNSHEKSLASRRAGMSLCITLFTYFYDQLGAQAYKDAVKEALVILASRDSELFRQQAHSLPSNLSQALMRIFYETDAPPAHETMSPVVQAAASDEAIMLRMSFDDADDG